MSILNAITAGAGGVALTGDTAGNLVLQSAGTTFATGNQYGIGLGTAVPSSGIGIAFPATQSASSNANTLDDYEEGTWTPVCNSGSGSIGSYSSNGTYTKVGRIVTAWFSFTITTVGSASGGVDFSGLPFSTLDGNQNLGVLREVISSGAIYFINTSGSTGSIQSSSGGGIVWTNGLSYRGLVTFQTST